MPNTPAYLGDAFTRAYGRTRADSSLQFAFDSPPPIPHYHMPPWLRQILGAIGRALGPIFQAIGRFMPPLGFWQIAAWVLLATVAVGLLFLLGRALLQRRRGKVPARVKGLNLEPERWRPAPAQARALLQEADQLAAQGLYAEAAHLLLLRSVEDIQNRRPGLVRPALTSRELAMHPGLPPAARTAFTAIAKVVERSLFGGRPVDAEAYAACRRTYEQFAFPDAWTAPAPAAPSPGLARA
jgi:hypothetical protein